MSNKKYSRPNKPFDKIRIEEENILVERYGLKTYICNRLELDFLHLYNSDNRLELRNVFSHLDLDKAQYLKHNGEFLYKKCL